MRASPLRVLVALVLAGTAFVPWSDGTAAPAVFSGSEFSVRGEFLKPEIVVVMSRENLNKAYDLTLDEDFLVRIVKSVEAEPF